MCVQYMLVSSFVQLCTIQCLSLEEWSTSSIEISVFFYTFQTSNLYSYTFPTKVRKYNFVTAKATDSVQFTEICIVTNRLKFKLKSQLMVHALS